MLAVVNGQFLPGSREPESEKFKKVVRWLNPHASGSLAKSRTHQNAKAASCDGAKSTFVGRVVSQVGRRRGLAGLVQQSSNDGALVRLLRANFDSAVKFQEAQTQLSGSLGRLLAITENYPDLKSNQNFLALQSQLEGTENRIAIARRDYITAVKDFNTEIKTIPGRWWRSLLYPDAEPMQNFTVSEETTKVPEVKF